MYPNEIYEQRELENLPGLSYDPDNKKTLFAEDILQHGEQIIAIEETLGENPQGDYDTVVERLDNMGGGGGGATMKAAVIGFTTNMAIVTGFQLINNLDTVEFDTTAGAWDNTNHKLVAIKNGCWRLGGYLECGSGPRYILTVYKNGSEYHRIYDSNFSNIQTPQGSTLCYVEEEDELEFYLYCSDNSTYMTGGRLELQEVF